MKKHKNILTDSHPLWQGDNVKNLNREAPRHVAIFIF